MKEHIRVRGMAALLCGVMTVQSAWAAESRLGDERRQGERGQAEFFNTNSDHRLEVRINFVSGVQQPGIYHFPDTINLLEAISLAGGAIQNADLSNVYVKEESTSGTKTYHYDLAKNMAQRDIPFPTIHDHDTVMIEVSNPSQSVMTTLGVVSLIVGIVATGLLIQQQTKKK